MNTTAGVRSSIARRAFWTSSPDSVPRLTSSSTASGGSAVIAASSNVGIGNFYGHFDHKRELLQTLMVERAPLLSRVLAPDDLLDRDRLVERLRITVDDPIASGMWRAWHEAVLEERDVARFHSRWFGESQKELAATVVEARKRSKRKGRLIIAPVAAWTIMTLARELGIHDRRGAPDVGALAQVIQEVAFGKLDVD
jgi:AcrR family transcriptional regulator